MGMHRTLKRTVAAGGLAGLLLLGAPACSDEDGDGNSADEEGEELEDRARDAGDEVEQQVDEGAEENQDSGG
ncbi:MAG: hypothetical protein K0R11_377 [Acidimicrobiales bacterium]|jgi:hypothetical protein|nr:hypothetical protein [Acidimicrobiales bacterium]